MRKTESPCKKTFLNLFGLARKSRSKEATWSKSENSVKLKKFHYINISKLEYVLL